MEYLRKVVRTNKEPDEKEVLWVDTAHPDYPVMKYYENGNWKLIRQREDGVAYIMPYGGIPYSDLSQEVKMAIASGGAQANWNQTNSASPDFIWNKPYIPTALADLTEDSNHKFVSATEKNIWNNKADVSAIPDVSGKADRVQSAVAGHIATLDSSGNLTDSGKGISDINPLWGNIQGSIENQTDLMSALGDKYEKPSTGIPASDLAAGVIPDVSNFITKSVDDLVNYYLKSETYTKAEVQALIGAIQSFHYEIYASTAAVTNPQGNVLYLIGPTGSGEDRYEEYVYDVTKQNPWVKIGDTSIDLSNYVTTSDLNTALAAYTTSAELETILEDYVTSDDLENLLEEKQSYDSGTSFPQNPKEGDVFVLTSTLTIDYTSNDFTLDTETDADGAYMWRFTPPNWSQEVKLQTISESVYSTSLWFSTIGHIYGEPALYKEYPFGLALSLNYDFVAGGSEILQVTDFLLSFRAVAGTYLYSDGRWVKSLSQSDRIKWGAKYSKPSTGIPKTDLASAVQTSLGKADTAYQKPVGGIPKADLVQAVQDSLGKADGALQGVIYDENSYGLQPDISMSLARYIATEYQTPGIYFYEFQGEHLSDDDDAGEYDNYVFSFVFNDGGTSDLIEKPLVFIDNGASFYAYRFEKTGSGNNTKYSLIRYADEDWVNAQGFYKKPSTGIPASDIAPGVIPAGVTVDQTYDPTSQNAQAGVAMAGALAGKQDTIDATHKLSYNLLSDTPSIPAAQVQTDWNASSGMGVLLNKPTLATVATSGSYTDLSNKPTIPTVEALTTSEIDTIWNNAS